MRLNEAVVPLVGQQQWLKLAALEHVSVARMMAR